MHFFFKFQVRPVALRGAAYNIKREVMRVFPFNTAVIFYLTGMAHGTICTVYILLCHV